MKITKKYENVSQKKVQNFINTVNSVFAEVEKGEKNEKK